MIKSQIIAVVTAITIFMGFGNIVDDKSVLEDKAGALYFVFMDLNEVETIISFYELELTNEQRAEITKLAYKNNDESEAYYQILKDKGETKEAIDEYNKNIQSSQETLIKDLKELLGDKYDEFEHWFNELWKDRGYKIR